MTDWHSRRTLLSAFLLGFAGFLTPLATRAAPLKADKVVILKSRRRLLLLSDGRVFETFRVALGSHPVGPKQREGDGRTPEGFYRIDGRNPHSPYHLSLHISYPNEIDRISSSDDGVGTGGDICIHGLPAQFGHTDPVGYFRDWTDGCISVGNVAIEKIWAAVDDGTAVEIRA